MHMAGKRRTRMRAGQQAACAAPPNCGGHGAVTPGCACACDAGWATAADQAALAAGGGAAAVFCSQADAGAAPGAPCAGSRRARADVPAAPSAAWN